MYPHFLNLASKVALNASLSCLLLRRKRQHLQRDLSSLLQNASHSFAVAQLDYLEHAAPSVAVAPAFSVYHQGRKVDDFFGASPQRLMDHAWLHGLET